MVDAGGSGRNKATGLWRWASAGLLVVLFASNAAVLGYLSGLRRDLDAQEARQAAAEASQEQLEQEVAAALVVANADTGERSLAEVESELDGLERTLLGFNRRPGATDLVGDMEADIERLRADINDLRSCLNRVVSSLSFGSSILPRC